MVKSLSFYKVLGALMTLLSALVLGACSGDDGDRLERFASADCRYVVRVDLAEVIEQYGCKRADDGSLELSGGLKGALRLLPADMRVQLTDVLENPYIVYDEAIAIENGNGVTAVAFSVSDASDFIKREAETAALEVHSGGGWDYVTLGDRRHILARGRTGLLIVDDTDSPAATAEALEKNAQAAPLAKVFADGLRREGRTVCLYAALKAREMPDFAQPLLSGKSRCMLLASDALNSKKWNLQARLLDTDGKPLKSPLEGKVDASLLRYAGKGHNAAVLAADGQLFMQRLTSATNDLRFSAIAANIKGPMMLSANLSPELLESGGEQGLSLCGAFTCLPGKARSVLDRYANALAPPTARYERGKSLSFTLKSTYYAPAENYWEDDIARVSEKHVSFLVEGDILVISVNAEPGASAVAGMKVPAEAALALVADLPRQSPLLQNFSVPFGLTATASVSGNELNWDAAVTDTGDSFPQCLLKLAGLVPDL